MKRNSILGFGLAGLAAGVLAVAGMSASLVSQGWAGDRGDDRAAAGEQTTPRCLDGRRIGRTHVVNDHTLLIYDEFGNPYKLGVGGQCRGMSDFSTFGFEFTGSSDICKAHDATLLRTEPPSGGVWRCIINSVEPLSRADAAALDK